jgi:hypothetical protein
MSAFNNTSQSSLHPQPSFARSPGYAIRSPALGEPLLTPPWPRSSDSPSVRSRTLSTYTQDASDDASIRDDVSFISAIRPVPPLGPLPEIPAADLDLSLSLDSILGSTSAA